MHFISLYCRTFVRCTRFFMYMLQYIQVSFQNNHGIHYYILLFQLCAKITKINNDRNQSSKFGVFRKVSLRWCGGHTSFNAKMYLAKLECNLKTRDSQKWTNKRWPVYCANVEWVDLLAEKVILLLSCGGHTSFNAKMDLAKFGV